MWLRRIRAPPRRNKLLVTCHKLFSWPTLIVRGKRRWTPTLNPSWPSFLLRRYNKKVASFAILGDNRPAWRPDRFGYEVWGTRVGIEFSAAKLLDYASDEAALESNPNLFAPIVLAHLKTLETAHDDEARRVSLVRQVKGLYARGLGAEQIRRLYALIDTGRAGTTIRFCWSCLIARDSTLGRR